MRKLILGFFSLFIVGALWSSAWFYAAHEAASQLDAWLKAEKVQGRTWTCPDRSIEGYPASLTVSCTDPTYAGRTPGQTVKATVGHLLAEWSITHPRHIVVTLQSPLAYQTSDGSADVKANWSKLIVEVGGLPKVGTITLLGADLRVAGTFGETGSQAGTAARLDASFTESEGASDPTLDFSIAVHDTPIPAVDDLLGAPAPVDMSFAGSLNLADVGQARTPEEAIEAWREAGGQVDLRQARLSHAEARVSGAGVLRLDDAHRPDGRLDASFVGLEPVLKRYGINGNLAAAGSLLNTLFGGGHRQSAPDVPGALNLPISFHDGRLGIGPVRTQVAFPPLY